MKILFVVTELNSANGICAQSVMREFTARGDKVYCITNNEAHGILSPEIQYFYVKPRLVYRLLTSRKKTQVFVGTILNKIKLVMSYPTWPLISPIYTMRIYGEAERICRENKVDVIIPIYTQIDTLIAAQRVKMNHPQISYIPYFLDSLSGGYGPKCFSKDWIVRRGIKWEDRLLKTADKIVMMQSSLEHYLTHSNKKEYFHKMIFLDLPLITRPEYVGSKNRCDKFIHLVYVGTIPAYIRNPEIFLKIFTKTDNRDYRLHIIGTSTCSDMLNEYARKDSRIVVEGPISHDEAVKRIADADILVNFGNNNSTMTPSKIFEYMSFGKPIISTMPIANEPSAVYLKKYPLSHLVDYTDTDLDDAATRMQFWIDRVIGSRIPFETVEELFICNTPKRFLDIMM